jgi:disulfide bond formation protein DsbB
MSTLIEEGIQGGVTQARTSARAASPAPRRKPRVWEIAVVSAAVCFGVAMVATAPKLYDKLVSSHTPRPEVASVAAGAGAVAVDPAAAARGKALFAQGCNACHGDNARGRVGLGKDLAHNPFVKSQGDAQLVGFLKRGRDISDPLNTTKIPMPPKGGNPALNDKQLADLAAYLRDLQ